MGNRLSYKAAKQGKEAVISEGETKDVEDGKREKNVFSCGVFKRKTSSIFLDYEGLPFEEYFRRRQSGSKSSARNSLAMTQDTLYSKLDMEQVTSATSDNQASDNPIYSQISDLNITSESNSEQNLKDKNFPIYQSITDVDLKDNQTGRQLKFSMERQLSNNTEEADDIASLYCLENDSENDEFECRDSDQFYRPWSLTQSPPSEKHQHFDLQSDRSDTSLFWKDQISRRNSSNSRKSEADPSGPHRKRSQSRRSVRSNRSFSRRVSISHLNPHDQETGSLYAHLGIYKEDSKPQNTAAYSNPSAKNYGFCVQNDKKCCQVQGSDNPACDLAELAPASYLSNELSYKMTT